jgi:hypothetical protein
MKTNQIILEVLSKEELMILIGDSVKDAIGSRQFDIQTEQELLTREEVCKLLKIDSSTLWRWTVKGVVLSYGIGSRRFYKKEELLKSLLPLKHLGYE